MHQALGNVANVVNLKTKITSQIEVNIQAVSVTQAAFFVAPTKIQKITRLSGEAGKSTKKIG